MFKAQKGTLFAEFLGLTLYLTSYTFLSVLEKVGNLWVVIVLGSPDWKIQTAEGHVIIQSVSSM